MEGKNVTAGFFVLTVLCFCVFVTGCAPAEKPELLIPIGRLRDTGEVRAAINSEPFDPRILDDGYGGQWLGIPLERLHKRDRVTVTFVKTGDRILSGEDRIETGRWTEPSPYIDSDNPKLRQKAKELTAGCQGADEKAGKILEYVVHEIAFQLYPGMHRSTASRTLDAGYGICVNHSRLFVALCRAAGVPARTVSGAHTGEDNRYYHHEWVEFYDGTNWHALEPTFSDDLRFENPRRLDLVYEIEANSLYRFDSGWEKTCVVLKNGSISVFCPDWREQQLTGRMSFEMVRDQSPDSVEVTVEYDMAKYLK